MTPKLSEEDIQQVVLAVLAAKHLTDQVTVGSLPIDVAFQYGLAAVAFLEQGRVEPIPDSDGFREIEGVGLCIDANGWETVLAAAEWISVRNEPAA